MFRPSSVAPAQYRAAAKSSAAADDTLGHEEPRGELDVVAGRAHRHGERTARRRGSRAAPRPRACPRPDGCRGRRRSASPVAAPRFSAPPDARTDAPSKNSVSNAEHSSARTPPTTSTRWFSRRSRTTSHCDPHAPAFGSHAPSTSRGTRARTVAPAHIRHGSRVTTRVQSSSRQRPRACDAARRAWTSAWPVGSSSASRVLWPRPTTRRSGRGRPRRPGRRR